MRKPTPAASLARLVAVLFAAPVIAHALPAAVAVHSSSGTSSSASTSGGSIANAPAGMGLTSTAPAASSSGTSGSSGTTGSSGSNASTNTTTTDQRAAATTQAAQAERASGNTAASQLASATAPRGAAIVSPTTGASTTNSTATTVSTGGSTTSGTTGTTVVGTTLGFPGAIGTIVNSGEPVVDANGSIVSASAAYAVTPPVTEATSFAAPQYVAADVVVADNTMNQVIGETRRDRRRIGRNGQLLYSIAPRTNVDRSREVPDDGPTPALTGPLSR